MTSEQFVLKELDVIAERLLIAKIGDQPSEVRVRFGKPLPHPEGGWFCPYEIAGLGSDAARCIGGVDAVQALQLAMYMAGADLRARSNQMNLTFLGEDNIGFPVSAQESTGSRPHRKSGGADC
jgi:hypothetical protein